MNKDFPRHELVEVLTKYNQELGASKETIENIYRLTEKETVVVITGQQAGILTGPLYTIYKALTVIQQSKQLTKKGIPTVPLFWIASEDHDFIEIASLHFLNRTHQELELRLDADVSKVDGLFDEGRRKTKWSRLFCSNLKK